jgi:hypothetical protein
VPTSPHEMHGAGYGTGGAEKLEGRGNAARPARSKRLRRAVQGRCRRASRGRRRARDHTAYRLLFVSTGSDTTRPGGRNGTSS